MFRILSVKGYVKKQINICKQCSEKFIANYKGAKCCGPTCLSLFMGKKFKGVNNPNYGIKWTEEQKRQVSHQKRISITDETREKISRAKKGVKRSPEAIYKSHCNRTPESYSRPHSAETKEKLSLYHKTKFLDEEYKKKFIEEKLKAKEKKGTIVRRDKLSEWRFYWVEANWLKSHSSMWRLAELGKEKLKEFGVFCPNANKNGCVRDHIVGRKFGFNNGVFPEILRHPCNCQILTAKENGSPEHLKNKIEDLEILFDRILSYEKPWIEQELCANLINNYKNGERWVKSGISD